MNKRLVKKKINQKNRMLKECTEECESNASGNFPFESAGQIIKTCRI